MGDISTFCEGDRRCSLCNNCLYDGERIATCGCCSFAVCDNPTHCKSRQIVREARLMFPEDDEGDASEDQVKEEQLRDEKADEEDTPGAAGSQATPPPPPAPPWMAGGQAAHWTRANTRGRPKASRATIVEAAFLAPGRGASRNGFATAP